MDSRPSDAIALALRTGAPVYVTRELLELVGYETGEGETQIEQAIERFSELEPQLTPAKKKTLTSVKTSTREQTGTELSTLTAEPAQPSSPADLLSQLQARLEQAVICEEYEEAAKLRDEIDLLVSRAKS